ncbi:MAG: hypothetical protein U5K75_08365 [Ahrensia sp.]|nr:hypothetical protein [Ahrensia sp.]
MLSTLGAAPVRFEDQDNNLQNVATRYLARDPESLVLSGYRGWLAFAADRDISKLEAIWNEFSKKLDHKCALMAMSGLENLIRKMGVCAQCPLRFHCQGTKNLCRDECLMLALISSLQNGDEESAYLSASTLTSTTSAKGAIEVLASATEFAMALKLGGKQLLPIEAGAVRWIIEKSPNPESATVH